jgi:hypothetical protein
MVVIPFTRQRNLKGPKQPTLFDKIIQITSEVKYPGLILDKGLKWKKQLYNAINKAYGYAEVRF